MHFEEAGINKTSALCDRHFSRESFLNFGQYQAGHAQHLLLSKNAIPSLYTVGQPPAPGKITTDIGCQTDSPRKKSVSTQWKIYCRSEATQTRPPSLVVSTYPESFQPSKKRRLTLDDDEHVGDSIQVTPLKAGVPKFVCMREDGLLQLFEECPVCSSPCQVQKTTARTLLTVVQLCPQCLFSRKWRIPHIEETVTSSDTFNSANDPGNSATAISESNGFSVGRDSSGEGASKVPEEEHNPDSSDVGQIVEVNEHNYSNALDPLKRHNIDEELPDEEQSSEVDSPSDSDWDWDSSGSDTDEKHNEKPKKPLKLCPECGTFFISQAHTCEDKKPYVCNVCGKRILTESGLKAHSKLHEEGYKHECKYCLSTFRTRPVKLVHEQSHLPAEKPYQCPDCPQVFARMRARNDHLVSHRGPKRHICHICNMEFPTNHILERHMAVHTKVKRFVCEVCQRSFTQSSHLKSHMRVHTGEKPYQCQHCDKAFNHNVSLKSHIQRYHGQDPDPRMEVQMGKKSSIESEKEKDETNETASSAADAEEAEKSMDTLCNAENVGVDKKKKEGKCPKRYRKSTGRPKGRPKKNAVITLEDANQLKRPLSISGDKEKVMRKRKTREVSESTDEEQEEHDSDSDFEPGNESEVEKNETNEIASSGIDAEEVEPNKHTQCNAENGGDEKEENMGKRKRCTGRPRGRPKKYAVITSDENEDDQDCSDSADEEQMHDSDSDFVPEGWRPQKKDGPVPRIKDRGGRRGKQK